MSHLRLYDRVKETSLSTGTGAFALLGPVQGYRNFNDTVGSGNPTVYVIEDQEGGANWEVGSGVYGPSGNSLLNRATNGIIASSNNGALVNFTSGRKNVFISLSAVHTLSNVHRTSFPQLPLIGQRCHIELPGRHIAYEWNGSSWVPITALSATTFYVDQPSGTDSQDKGFGTNSNAFKTIGYAITQVPPVNNGDVTILVGTGVYKEEVIIRDKSFNGNYKLYIKGNTGNAVVSSTTFNGALNGAGTSGSFGWGHLRKNSAGWFSNDFQHAYVRMLTGAGAGQVRLIHRNSSSGLITVGRWETVPTSGDNFDIVDLRTLVDGSNDGVNAVRENCIQVTANQKNVEIHYIRTARATNAGFYIRKDSSCDLYYCKAQSCIHNYYVNAYSECNMYECYSDTNTGTGAGEVLYFNASFGNIVYSKFMSDVSVPGLYVQQSIIGNLQDSYIGQGSLAFGGQNNNIYLEGLSKLVMFGYNEFDVSDNDGILITQGSILINNDAGNFVRNAAGWGVQSTVTGFGSSVSSFIYQACVNGNYTPATTLSGGNT